MDRAVRYAVYRFASGEKVDTDNPARLLTLTSDTFVQLPYETGTTKYTYVVTALDRLHNESAPAKRKVKL